MPTMRLQGKTIGYFVAQEVEDLEYWVPLMRLREEGARVISIGLTTQTVRGKHGLEMTPDISIDEAPRADELDGLVIPGGWAPDKLRRSQKVLQLVRDMDAQGKIIGTICHGGWVPISAAGSPSRQASCGDAKLSARPVSKTISSTRAAPGLTKPRSGRGTWCGAGSSRTSRISAGSWLPPSLDRCQPLMKIKCLGWIVNVDESTGCH